MKRGKIVTNGIRVRSYTVQSEDSLMQVRSDARATGIVTALSHHASQRKPRTYSRASACISYYADDKSDAVIFREAPKNRRVRAAKNFPSNIPAHRITAADLRPIFAD